MITVRTPKAFTGRSFRLWLLPFYVIILCNISTSATHAQTEFKYYISDTTYIHQQLNKAKKLLLAGYSDSAASLFLHCLYESKLFFYNFGVIKSQIGLGNSYVSTGAYPKAIRIYSDAIPLCTTRRTRQLLTTLYNNIANIYTYWGNFEQSMLLYEKALQSAEVYGAELPLETIYNNISIPLNKLGQPRKALYYINKGEELALQKDNFYTLADLSVNKGAAYNLLGDNEKSKSYYQTALNIAERYEYVNVRHTAHTNLGILELNKGNAREALEYFQRAEKEKGSLDPYYYNLRILATGAAYLKLKDYNKAEPYLKKSLYISEKSNILKDMITSHGLLAYVYAETGDYKSAYLHRTKEKELGDSMGKQENIKTATKIEAQYRNALKDKEIAAKQTTINAQKNDISKRNLLIIVSSSALLMLLAFLITQRRNYKHRRKLEQQHIQNLLKQQEIDVMKAIMNGEEQERIRLSRELHDSVMIQFSVVKMNLSSLMAKTQPEFAEENLHPLVIQLDQATDNLRHTAHKLMPDMLLEEGLAEALYHFCEDLQKYISLKIVFQPIGEIPRLNVQFELSVYRIVQELIQNIVKHAGASEGIVQISFDNQLLSLTVEDNGRGMPIKKVDDNFGLGLKSIYARMASLKGRIDIQSDENIGTTVRMEFDKPEKLD